MTKEDILRNKFNQFQNYRAKRRNEPFEITVDEWIAFFKKSQAHYDAIKDRYGSTNIARADEEAPWSIGNLVVRVRKSKAMEPASDAPMAAMTADKPRQWRTRKDGTRILTKSQWIAELRDLEQST